MTTTIRYIDTTGLPKGYDVADLIASGTTGHALIAWCKDRVRPGYPPAEPRPESVPKKSPDTEGNSAGAGATPPPRGVEVKPTLVSIPVQVQTEGNLATILRPLPQAPPEDDEAMLPPEYSDDSLTREFTRVHEGQYLYVSSWGRWLYWDGARWVHDETMRVFHSIRMILREQANQILLRQAEFQSKTRSMAGSVSSARTIANVERTARAEPKHSADASKFDSDEWALNTPAGIVDLHDGSIRAPSLGDFCTKITRVAPGGECPTWLRFLDDVTNGDKEMVQYLQRVAGYALTGSTKEHALFFFFGTGRNGKGTFINTLEWIMGDYSRVASMDTFTESRNDRHTTELAALMGARMVTSQEVDEGKRWAEARIKSMSGGDPITARFMAKDNFTFQPQFKLIISGNHRPGLRNVDEAMRARLHLIPFTITVPVEKRDPNLSAKLREEAGGILAWAIAGCKEWDRIRLSPPGVVRRATDDYFSSQDTVGMWLRDECTVGLGNRGNKAELYRSYSRYAEEAGEFVVPRRRWLDALELKGIKEVKITGERLLSGVRIKTATEFD